MHVDELNVYTRVPEEASQPSLRDTIRLYIYIYIKCHDRKAALSFIPSHHKPHFSSFRQFSKNSVAAVAPSDRLLGAVKAALFARSRGSEVDSTPPPPDNPRPHPNRR